MILVVALNTYRELLRERFVHVVFFIAVLLYALSLLLGALSFDEQIRILVHFGFGAIHLTLLGVSAVLGSNLIAKEIERQTCLLVLARPLSRAQFYIGKWLGVVFLNFVIGIILCALLWLLLRLLGSADISFFIFFQVLLGVFYEVSILLALAMMVGIVLRPAIALFVVIGVFLIGNWLEDLLYFAKKSGSVLYLNFANVINISFPQLYRTNWRSLHLIQNNLIGTDFLWVTIHTLGWILFLITVGVAAFRRKDLV